MPQKNNSIFAPFVESYPLIIKHIITEVELYKKAKRSYLIILQDNKSIYDLEKNLPFFLGKQMENYETCLIPDYNCEPYDYMSPSQALISTKIQGLYKLVSSSKPHIILTTYKGLITKVIPKNILQNVTFKLAVNQQVGLSLLCSQLVDSGFKRVDNATSIGEFAARGDIVDLVYIADNGYRIDFLGDNIEKIRDYNPITQSSKGTSHNEITVYPVDETIMNENNIKTFKERYEAVSNDFSNILYQSIMAGIRAINYYHYLPLFYNRLDTVLDYLPSNTFTLIPENIIIKAKDYIQEIYNIYNTRLSSGGNNNKAIDGDKNFLLSPEHLYLNDHGLDSLLLSSSLNILTIADNTVFI